MSEQARLVLLSQYNQLMNGRQYAAISVLNQEQLNRDMGAFFRSVIGTLNHIVMADILWLKRFAKHGKYSALTPLERIEPPLALNQMIHSNVKELGKLRHELDEMLVTWCSQLTEADLARPLRYRNMAGQAFNKNFGALVLHLFLHQTHHRGQITTLLSQLGIDFGDTDLPEIIPNEPL